jgi:hypothetical protein
MSKYACEKCGTGFQQKSRYTAHTKKKTPCIAELPLDPAPLAPAPAPALLAQDTGKFRTNTKDQFYTNPAVAKKSIETILALLPFTADYLWVEPSAGNGSFLHNIPATFARIGLDLEPKAADIKKQDYLTWEPPAGKDIIVFGNPPFGRQSSLAKTFIKKSCPFASIVAFILPKSFTKPSMFNSFAKNFHLIHTTELDKNAFVLNGASYDVPCVFQIWQKKATDRPVEQTISPKGFQYVKATDAYDIAFRRVGGLAGKCYEKNGTAYSVQSHYFLKLEKPAALKTIMQKINAHIFPSNTVGPRSLSKPEVNRVLNLFILEHPS